MIHPNEISQSVINNYCVDVEKENKLLNLKLVKALKELESIRSENLYLKKDLKISEETLEIKQESIKTLLSQIV